MTDEVEIDEPVVYTVRDMIGFAMDKKPLEFQAAFDDVIGRRAEDAVDSFKQELGKTVFNPELLPDAEEEDNGEEFE